MLRVSEIAKRAGLSRTTILYYERCGLLKPALRSPSQYRLYGDREVRVLEQVRLYRSVGMSIDSIRAMLSSPENHAAALLKRRLGELETEINDLRRHQRAILLLLRSKDIRRRTKEMTKQKWVEIMKSAGFSEEDMHRWHREFERAAPDDHREFLQYLHIPEQEIRQIRDWSKKASA
jgi:DNA-binding transcriptional MerR regulator